jgi:predicted metal-dependent HD superfamily phosphohydrolase
MYDFKQDYIGFFDIHKAGSDQRSMAAQDFVFGLSSFLEKEYSVPKETATAIARCTFHRMMDPQLHYHTPVHILAILQFYQEQVRPKKKGPTLIKGEELALWFHDAIYIPSSKKKANEEQSAQFACALMAPYLSVNELHKLSIAIGVTASHSDPAIASSWDLLLDLDLHNFSLPREDYLRQSECIRREFGHISDMAFYEGRKKLLGRLIKPDGFFRSPFFKENFEEAALKNLKEDGAIG